MSHRPKDPHVRAQLSALGKLKWQERNAAIEALAESEDPAVETILLYLLDHHDPTTRETALEALSEIGGPPERLAARAMLEDPNSFVRNRAAEVLGEVGDRVDIMRLGHALHDQDWVVRATAGESLGRIGGKKARTLLLAALAQERNPIVRRDVAVGLGYLEDPSLVPILEEALPREKQDQARLGLLLALYTLGQRERLPALLELFSSEDYQVRHALTNAIEETILPEDLPEALRALEAMVREATGGLKIDGAATARRIHDQLRAQKTD